MGNSKYCKIKATAASMGIVTSRWVDRDECIAVSFMCTISSFLFSFLRNGNSGRDPHVLTLVQTRKLGYAKLFGGALVALVLDRNLINSYLYNRKALRKKNPQGFGRRKTKACAKMSTRNKRAIADRAPFSRLHRQTSTCGNVLSSSFSHPDCTVGSGVSPDPALLAVYQLRRLAGLHALGTITAGREFHPAPKECVVVYSILYCGFFI
jgi:hypothetical protein